jgi:hypothetical protein
MMEYQRHYNGIYDIMQYWLILSVIKHDKHGWEISELNGHLHTEMHRSKWVIFQQAMLDFQRISMIVHNGS